MATEKTGGIAESIAVDRAKGIIYADINKQSDSAVLSRIRDEKRANPNYTLKFIEATDLAALRAETHADDAGDEDRENSNRRQARDLICRAADYGATNIRIQRRENDTLVRFVVDGRNRHFGSMTAQEGEDICRAMWQGLAPTTDNSYKPFLNQQFQIPGSKFPASTALTSVRGARGPCYGGELMVLRLQYGGGYRKSHRADSLPFPKAPPGEFRLPGMGFSGTLAYKLDYLMKVTQGLVLTCGPTGSGKTMTNYELLSERQRRRPYQQVVTVEDPVEIPIDSASQLLVTNASDAEETGDKYQDAIRFMLRIEPKIIYIGEIRDAAVASMAFEAARGGHPAYSTLHTNDSFGWVGRLEGLKGGVLHRKEFCEEGVIAGIISQRVVSRLCPHCSIPLASKTDVSSELSMILDVLSTWGNLDGVRLVGPGCPQCNQSGLERRHAIAEIIVMDRDILRDFVKEGSEVAAEHYFARLRKPGLPRLKQPEPPLVHQAVELMLNGFADPAMIEEETAVLQPKDEVMEFQPPRKLGVVAAR